jgi:hypothetical protein
MRTWLAWFATFLVLEAYALWPGTRFPTLSQTWRELRDTFPPWLSLTLTAATGAVFVWLIATHWVFSVFDRPGLDRIEVASILLGVVVGLVGGHSSLRRRPKPGDNVDGRQPKV